MILFHAVPACAVLKSEGKGNDDFAHASIALHVFFDLTASESLFAPTFFAIDNTYCIALKPPAVNLGSLAAFSLDIVF